MWTIFSNLETVLGFIGSLFSVGTFLLALNVKKQVNAIIDRVDFRENFVALSGIIAGVRDTLKSNTSNPDIIKSQVFELIAELESNYSFLPRKVKKTLKNLKIVNYEILFTNNDEKIKLNSYLITLENYLKKETV